MNRPEQSAPLQPELVEQGTAVSADGKPAFRNDIGDIQARDLGWSPQNPQELVGRRLFLARAAVIGAGAVIAGKLGAELVTNKIWPYNLSELRWLPECEPLVRDPRRIAKILAMFQGTGRIHARPYCESMAHNVYRTQSPDNTTLALYTDLGNYKASPDDWAWRLLQISRFGDEMDATTISAGTASLFAAYLLLLKLGIRVPVLGEINIVTGIVDERDHASVTGGKLISGYADVSRGTVVDKTLMATGDRLRTGTMRRRFLGRLAADPFDLLQEILYEGTHGSPPGMIGNQARAIEHGVDLDRDGHVFAPAIKKGITSINYFFIPDDPAVNNQSSFERLERFANLHDIPINKIVMPAGTKHADVETASLLLAARHGYQV